MPLMYDNSISAAQVALWIMWATLGLATIVLLASRITQRIKKRVEFRRYMKKRAEEIEARNRAVSNPPPSGNPDELIGEVVIQVPPAEKLTARESRELAIFRHVNTSDKCLYCNAQATEPIPTIEPVNPWFKGILRWLNVTPNSRWSVEPHPTGRAPGLCVRHHEWVVGFFDERIAKERSDYANYINEVREAMHRFEQYEFDELMQKKMQEMKRGKPARTKPLPDNVKALPTGRTANGA